MHRCGNLREIGCRYITTVSHEGLNVHKILLKIYIRRINIEKLTTLITAIVMQLQ